MKIAGLQKLTLLDYPSHIASIVFTQGCNLACPFCQNSKLIKFNKKDLISELEVFDYLEKRKNILEGVVISGGEPLLQQDIKNFIQKIKKIGLKVKLDTNGTMPERLKFLLDEDLLDYVAIDIKNDINNYETITGTKSIDINKIKQSIKLLKNSKIDYEFRTTIMKEFHNIDNIKRIISLIGKSEKYYLQNLEISEYVLNKKLTPFTKEELIEIKAELINDFPNLNVRGI